MTKHITLRLEGEAIEVDLSTGEPMFRVTDIANVLGYSTATALLNSTSRTVRTLAGLFIDQRSFATDYAGVEILLRDAHIASILRRMVTSFFSREIADLRVKALAYRKVPTVRWVDNADTAGRGTVRSFLAVNNIELNDGEAKRLGIRASRLRTQKAIPKEVVTVFIQSPNGKFVTCEENNYPYSVIYTAFLELFK